MISLVVRSVLDVLLVGGVAPLDHSLGREVHEATDDVSPDSVVAEGESIFPSSV